MKAGCLLVRTRALLAALALALGSGAGIAAADVVAVVSAKSRTAVLSANQVVDIFLGRSSRYPDGRPAVPIDQAEGRAVRDEFYLKFCGKSQAQLNAHWSKIVFTGRGQPPTAVLDDEDLKKHLVANPNAIGYLERAGVDDSVKVILPP